MADDNRRYSGSTRLFAESRKYLSGGVSSGMRSAAKPLPLFFSSAAGCHLTDVDGNQYIDYVLGWGPLILGHAHPAIVQAVTKQSNVTHLLGAQHELEIEVAKQICDLVPSAERVIFSNTGTEAVQVALRLARSFTGKRKVIRFEGHYHGWMENIAAGYRPQREVLLRDSVDQSAEAHELLVLPWNDIESVKAVLENRADEIAAIILEPILCNSCCLMPKKEYLQSLRELTKDYGVILIFDEVITGFRVALGGAQELFGVIPDLTTMGKAIAGGVILSAIAGRRKIMELVADGRVPHAGTFNGNPLSLAAARATLDVLASDKGNVLERIRKNGEKLMAGIGYAARAADIPVLINGVGSCFHVAFTTRPSMQNFRDTLDAESEARDEFLVAMLASGVYLIPDGRWYVSAAHTEQDVSRTLEIINSVFAEHKSKLRAASPIGA